MKVRIEERTLHGIKSYVPIVDGNVIGRGFKYRWQAERLLKLRIRNDAKRQQAIKAPVTRPAPTLIYCAWCGRSKKGNEKFLKPKEGTYYTCSWRCLVHMSAERSK